MNSKRAGFTLVELLVVVTIGTIVMTAVMQVMATQERVNRQQIAVVGTEQNVRMALAIIESDLREVSAVDGDILDAGEQTIQVRALRKAGIICGRDLFGWVDVAVWGQPFAATDNILVFQEGASETSAADDTWGATTITAVAASACAGNPIGNVQRISIPVANVLLTDTGGLVRSYVTVTYALANSGGKGVLNRTENGVTSNVIEDLATTANEGLRFKYYNAAGTEITPTTAALRATIMRIQVKAKGSIVGGQSGANRTFTDSLMGMVFLRGNKKTS